jgi:hypothetical protein
MGRVCKVFSSNRLDGHFYSELVCTLDHRRILEYPPSHKFLLTRPWPDIASVEIQMLDT